MPNFMQQPPQHSVMGGPAMSPVAAAGGGVFPGAPIQPANVAAAEVVPLPDVQASAAEGSAVGGFMAKFQVHFPHTGNDNPARRITSGDHTDTSGWIWRLVLHPWGHDARGCYSAFLELANADSLPLGFSRYVKLEFAMHAWDAAYHRVEPIRTQFLLHKFNGQATDFGYTRAFEHEIIMAQRNIFIDPQGFVRISVKIIDVREAFFRVATDVDLARSVTGRGGGGDFADWRTCLPAKSFKHDQLLYVIQKVSELTGVPLVSCRPWLCMPRDNGNGPVGPVRPVAALLPQHLQMTISEALGDRPQYHIYLEEVDTNPEVWARRRAFPRDLPAQEAGQLLLTGRAYAQLPNEVFLVFLKIDRRIILAHTAPQDPLALSAVPAPAGPENQPEFVFVGKAMAHMTDRGCELAPIAKNLAHLPQSLNLEVFEQIAPEEVRRFSGDKTVAEAGLSHGSVLLFRSALQEPVTCPPPGAKQAQIAQQQQHAVAAPAVGVSSCVPFNAAAAAAAAAAMAAHAAVTRAPTSLALPARSGGDAAGAAGTASAPAAASAIEHVAASATAAGASAEATDAPAPAPVTAAVPGSDGDASMSQESPPALIPAAAVAGNGLTANGTGGYHEPAVATATAAAGPKHDKTGTVAGGAEKNAPGWDGGHIAAAAGPAVGVVGAKGTSGGEKAVVMDAEAQQRATYLALFQVQENARQHQVKEAARAVAKKLAAEAALAAAKEKFKKDEVVLSGGGAGFSAAAAKIVEGEGRKAVAVAEAAAVAAAAAMKAPATPVLTLAEKAEVAAAAKMAAHAAAMEHAQSRAANTYRTISITEALREGAPPTPSVPAPPATAVSDGPAVAGTVSGQAAAQAATAVSMGTDAKLEATTSPGSVAPVPSMKELKSINVAAPVSTASSVSSLSIAADAGAAAKVGDIDAGGETESGAEMQVDVDGGADVLPNTAVVTDTPTDTLIGGTDPSEKNGSSEDGSAPSSTTPGCTTPDKRGAAAAADGPDDENTALTTGNPTRSTASSRHAPNREQTGAAPSSSSIGADEKEGGDSDKLVETAAAEVAVTVPAARATPTPVAVPRATRASKAAAAAVGSSEDDDGPDSGGVAVVAVPVEMHRRSSRKAAAVAAQQIQTTARAGTRGGGGGGGGGSVSTDVAVLRSPRGVNDDGGSGGQKRKAEEGEGQVSKKLSKVDTGGSSEMSAVPAASPVPSDLSAFIAQLMHVPGFTMEKCMELTRSKERAEIASAIKTMSPDEKDSFRSRQLERLLAIQEKEASSTDGVGGVRGE